METEWKTKEEGWAWQINNCAKNKIKDATSGECLIAMLKRRQFMGRQYSEKWLFNTWLDSDDRNAIAFYIELERA